MKTVLKVGCGVILGLGVLGLIVVLLIGQCLPPAPKPVTPTPEPLPPPTEKPSGGIIKDLAYIKGWSSMYSDDADPEYEGIGIHITWLDAKSEPIYFRNIPMSVSVEIFTYRGNWEQKEIMRCVYKGNVQIDSSSSRIRIPFEDINADPNTDDQFGMGRVVIHTPKQGDYSIEFVARIWYEPD